MTLIPFFEEYVDPNIKKEGPTITVSGLHGVGKTTIANKISEKLNLKFLSAGVIFRQIAKERGFDKLADFTKTREKEVDLLIDKQNLKAAQIGNAVIDARIASLLAGKFADTKILVKADYENIVERVAKRDKTEIEAAKKDLIERDYSDFKMLEIAYNITGLQEKVLNEKIYTHIVDNNGTLEELNKRIDELISNVLKTD